ncbi:Nn.00g019370.m01.CDS01 [Neocucurbitaria sp. VM-36]
MWRKNVLGLRKCSFTATNHGVHRWYSSERSLPVTGKEFEDALAKVLKWKTWPERKKPLGFAISGGVDSMALAALYAEARATNRLLPMGHGFIVDHKVRPESTVEAEWVAQQLRGKLGMEATVLPLTWPEDFDPLNPRRFETEARTLRYQALGRACREKNIDMLMVAHHGDDQAETVMMRLANKRLRSGLQAMQSVEWIPECEGIYGVHHSGKYQRNINMPFPVEQGGIQILRPLLAFEKSRLIATCEEKGVAWAEDKTNQIQTLTSRNAVRHICRNHKLPYALNLKSLVDVSLSMQKRVESHKAYAQKLFDQCLIKLDIQTGCLLVRFPPFSSLLARSIETESDRNEAKDNAYCLIERVAELVTPKPKPHLGQLAGMIDYIYPELEDPKESKLSTLAMQQSMKNRCVHGIWWRIWGKPSPFEVPDDGFNCAGIHPREWLLTRQPLDRGERNNPAHYMIYPPSSTTVSLTTHKPIRSRATFQLFDGRFWIRLWNHSSDTLTLRLFEKTDLQHLPTAQEEREAYQEPNLSGPRPYRYITAAFALLNPSDLRFTLPAVFRKDSATGKETLVGFPTLDVRIHGFGALDGVCEWSVHYKKINFGNRSAGDIIVPGSSRANIIAEEKRQTKQKKGIANLKLRQSQARGDNEVEVLEDKFTGFKCGSYRNFGKKSQGGPHVVFDKGEMEGEAAEGLTSMPEESARQGRKRKET